MENKGTADDEVFIFDSTSINHLTGNEFYFYSNHDATTYKKSCSYELHKEATFGSSSSTDPILNVNGKDKHEKCERYEKREKNSRHEETVLKSKKGDSQVKGNKLCKLHKKSQGKTNNYFAKEHTSKRRTYEEREKFVFEQEMEKVGDIYNVEEIMKIINNLNSIRKEIETVIYKKLEKKYKHFLVSTVKIKDIENYITNIKQLVVENMNELKLVQVKNYKESLHITDLVTKKKKFQKINLVILIIYIISIYDKLIFKSILKKDYEYASLAYCELFRYINENKKWLRNINCIHNLKEKMCSEYLNRLKQKNQTDFVEFLFANSCKKNLEMQLQKAFKIHYLLFKAKSSNFIENLLAYVYQCFRKISKQVIFSFLIVGKKRPIGKSVGEQKEEKREILRGHYRENEKGSLEEKWNEENSFSLDNDIIRNESSEGEKSVSSEKNADSNNHLKEMFTRKGIDKKNLNMGENGIEHVIDKKDVRTFHHMVNDEYTSFSTNDSMNDLFVCAYSHSDDLNEVEKKKIPLKRTNNTDNEFENEINHFQEEDNFLFIPLNELVQKLKEKDCFLSLVKIYEIVFDILNKYDFIIIYLLKCDKNSASSCTYGDADRPKWHEEKKNNNTPINHTNISPTKRCSRTNVENKNAQFYVHRENDTDKLEVGNAEDKHQEDPAVEKHPYDPSEDRDEDDPAEHRLEDDLAKERHQESREEDKYEDNSEEEKFHDNHRDNLNFYDLFNFCKNQNQRSIFSKYYQMNNLCDSSMTTYFIKNINEERYTFSENCLRIKEKVEKYLSDKRTKYVYCEEYIKFAHENANKLINDKNKFLKNIEKVIKTIIEHMRFENLNFNHTFGFIVITIMLCVNSFLFEHNCSNRYIYTLKKNHLRGGGKDEINEHIQGEKNEETQNLTDQKDQNCEDHSNVQEEKNVEAEGEPFKSLQGEIKSEEKSVVCYGQKGREKNESCVTLNSEFRSNKGRGEEAYSNSLISKSENKEKGERKEIFKKEKNTRIKCSDGKKPSNGEHRGSMNLNPPNAEHICREFFLDEYTQMNTFEAEKTLFFYRLLKNNIIFEEIEKKIRNNFSSIFYVNIKHLSDTINRDNWERKPIKTNQRFFKKRFHLMNVISFYKKTFNDFLNIPFSENPLTNLNFKKLEEELSSDEVFNEPLNISNDDVYGAGKKLSDHSNFVASSQGITSKEEGVKIRDRFGNGDADVHDTDETDERLNLAEAKRKICKTDCFEIVNFDVVASNSSSMLICVLQKYFTLEELLHNFKEEINKYMFKTIDFYIYVLCSFFMKKETIEELLIDLKRCSERMGVNNIYFIMKKQEKYKQLYSFLRSYNEEIKKETLFHDFFLINNNSSHFPQTKYGVGNFNNSPVDNSSPLFYLSNFPKIYSSSSLYALSEKIISIESLYCLIIKLKEEVTKTRNGPKGNDQNGVKQEGEEIKKEEIPNSARGTREQEAAGGGGKSICNTEQDSFLHFLDEKVRIVEELRILIYCDSLYSIIDSTNYINEVSKIISDACSCVDNKNKCGAGDEMNIKKKKLRKNLDQYMNLYMNILNDSKRKLMFCCQGTVSVVIHYLLWNLINYIFNLNNIEIIYKIKNELMPIVHYKNKEKEYDSHCNAEKEDNKNSAHTSASNMDTKKGEHTKKFDNKGKDGLLIHHHNSAKMFETNFPNDNSTSEMDPSSYEERSNSDEEYCIINMIRLYFSKISNCIIQNIKNLEKEIEKYQNCSDSNIQNTIYMKVYNDLKNDTSSKRHEFYYVFLSKGITYYDQYLDLHFCNIEKLDNLVKNCNSDFFQYKHIHSIILKYYYFKMIPESYIAHYEMGIMRQIQGKIKPRNV
ncbi:hypothetical protein POVWA2_000310 [Plasmodium ovale wallikeri]|uniref:Uncharacterized protein n=1 Tax=Plasmodium ovale wallikeri TaxID=864142 RepID=A0A1A8YFM4_PLAOA|nr:hypothetical protein POVWA1_000040 [Plasmodium ovale wallikeri]SBT30705.1 hypothetical protein POVWA2_000310 [Plasmodium ovale wallikeri]